MMRRPTPAWLTGADYAHRGLHAAGVPENSLAAAEAAIAAGLGIECDIQMSADGVPMVFHDWDLARMTGRPEAVAALEADALEALGLGGTEHSPVRLARFLEVVGGRVPLLIEVKSRPGAPIEPACRAVAGTLAGYRGAAAVMSFDPRVPEWFACGCAETMRGLVGTDSYENGFEGVWRTPAALASAQPDFLAIDVRDCDRPEAAAWRAGGQPLLTWTARSPETRAAALAHADALIGEGEGLDLVLPSPWGGAGGGASALAGSGPPSPTLPQGEGSRYAPGPNRRFPA